MLTGLPGYLSKIQEPRMCILWQAFRHPSNIDHRPFLNTWEVELIIATSKIKVGIFDMSLIWVMSLSRIVVISSCPDIAIVLLIIVQVLTVLVAYILNMIRASNARNDIHEFRFKYIVYCYAGQGRIQHCNGHRRNNK